MMDVDGEPMPKEVIIESIQTQSILELKQVEWEKLDRIQFVVEHGAALIYADAAERKAKVKVALICKDLDPAKKDAIDEPMVQSVIEAYFHDIEDDIIGTNLGVKPIGQG